MKARVTVVSIFASDPRLYMERVIGQILPSRFAQEIERGETVCFRPRIDVNRIPFDRARIERPNSFQEACEGTGFPIGRFVEMLRQLAEWERELGVGRTKPVISL